LSLEIYPFKKVYHLSFLISHLFFVPLCRTNKQRTRKYDLE
jgi:hypothetical protein